MKKFLLLSAILTFLSANSNADWVQLGENSRLTIYVDSTVRTNAGNVVVWVLFDYKDVQQSPRSGRRYLSEKAQYEIDLKEERCRVLFFTWHEGRLGNGKVVYTGNKPKAWEPTTSPDSIANGLRNFVAGKKYGP